MLDGFRWEGGVCATKSLGEKRCFPLHSGVLLHRADEQSANPIVHGIVGFRAKVRFEGNGLELTEDSTNAPNILHLTLDGRNVTVLNQTTDLRVSFGFPNQVSAAKVNEWNQHNRFSRAYINDAGKPFIEADLDLRGGATRGTVETFIKQFRETIGAYDQFLAPPGSRSSAQSKAIPTHGKSSSATTKIKAPFGDFALWIDRTKWKQTGSETVGTLQFQNVNGEGYAKLITERIGIPMDSLPEVALINTKKASPDAKLIQQEKRLVNGRQVLALQMDATITGIPARFYGYYYGGTSGTLQLVTYTASTAFDRNVEEFTKLLDGLEISDEELPPLSKTGSLNSPGVLPFNDGNMAIDYDPKKWIQTGAEAGRFTFKHSKGDAYVVVIAERVEVPTDSFPEIALANARKADPAASITFREKRRVNGNEVWFLKMETEARGIPLSYYGYYFGGKSGAVQILTYTGRNLVSEFENDLMDFLNGFRVTN